MSLPSEGQSLSPNQISSTYLNWRLRYNYFRFWKKCPPYWKSTFDFDFDHLSEIWTLFCIRLPNFVQIEAPTAKYDVISISKNGGRDSWILLPVSHMLMSLPSEGQIGLLANQILWRYLHWRLKYNYFRFRNTNVHHIGILLLISISTSSPQSECYSASGYRISSKSEHTLRKYDVISIYQHGGRNR